MNDEPTINARCFLTEDEGPCIGMIVMDEADGSSEKVFVGLPAYHLIFKGDAQAAGEFWHAMKQAKSAGYTEAGFAHVLRRDATALGFDLYTVEWKKADYLGLVIGIGMGYKMLNLSPTAIWPALTNAVCGVAPHISLPTSTAVLNRWIALQDFPDDFEVVTNYGLMVPLVARRAQLGHPDDLFQAIANLAGEAGYELIRRRMLA